MQHALKDIFGPMFESMLKGEMNHHLGYGSKEKKKQTINGMGTEKRQSKRLLAK